MNKTEIVKMLMRCSRVTGMIDDLTPDGMKVDLDTHSTATHCNIYLTIDGDPDLLVWYKTNWVSSSYEFNERDKTIGLQKKCKFIEHALIKFFHNVETGLAEHDQRLSDKSAQKELSSVADADNLISKYKKAYANVD